MRTLLSRFALALLLARAAQAGVTVEGPFQTPQGETLVMSDGRPLLLHKNPAARDQPLDRVLAFVASNTVNRLRYTEGKWVCSEYAVTLHDRAEANGFRCALVVLRFEEGPGHALNAFQTTDRGLVFIDCTGCREGDLDDRYDTIGYIEVGKPYGRLPIPLAVQGAFDYRFYAAISARQSDLSALERQLAAEYAQLSREQDRVGRMGGDGASDPVAAFERRKAQERLRERISSYRQQLNARQELARYLGVQFLENRTRLTDFQVFW